MENKKKKKILVPIFYRAHLGRLRSVLDAIRNHPDLELQIMTSIPVGRRFFWPHFRHSEPRSLRKSLPWYVRMRLSSLLSFPREKSFEKDALAKKIVESGFHVDSFLPLFLDGGTSQTMAKSVGLGILNIIEEINRLKPDIVFVNADRFEMVAPAIAAAYLNIPIAHNEAGDVSGTIDESVRHAITKFAQMHFTATEKSRQRVIQMGENPDLVFTVGSPVIDSLKKIDDIVKETIPKIDLEKPYILVMVHPVTTESHEENLRTVRNILRVLEKVKIPTILINGNSDAYSRTVGPEISRFVEEKNPDWLFSAKLMRPERFFRILKNASCVLGNSSSFIRESAYFGIPAVLVGTRQQARERGKNVLEVEAGEEKIEEALKKQLEHGRYPSDNIFGDGTTGEKIAEILAKVNPPIQKKFYDIK